MKRGSCSVCGQSFERTNASQKQCEMPCRIRAASSVDANGCWIWQKTKSGRNGYGSVGVAGEVRLAHRVSYEAFVAPIPDGMFVCHKCDVRDCVNPDHLFVGTRDDNMHDAAIKHRMPRRDGHPNAKLTSETVAKIKADNGSLRAVARKYGVGQTAIFQIRHGRYWADEHSGAPG